MKFLLTSLFLFLAAVSGIYFFLPMKLPVLSSSMMLTCLGPHWNLICARCGKPFTLTVDYPFENKVDTVRSAPCPHCGFSEVPVNPYELIQGDTLFVSRSSFPALHPERWSITAVKLPKSQGLAVKRVIGLPGEKIELIHGTIFIDGSPLSKPLESWSYVKLDLRPELLSDRILFKNTLVNPSLTEEDSLPSFSEPPVTNQIRIPSLEPVSTEKICYVNDFLFEIRSPDFLKSNNLLVNQGDRFWSVEVDADNQFRFSRLDNPDPDSASYFAALYPDSFPEPAGTFPADQVQTGFTLAFRDSALTLYDQKGDILFSFPNPPVSQTAVSVSIPAALFTDTPSAADISQISFARDIGWSVPANQPLARSLEDDEYFLLGDNSAVSVDSRDWGFPVKSSFLRKVVTF